MLQDNVDRIKKYASFLLILIFIGVVLFYLLSQEFFRPHLEDGNLNIFSVSVFLFLLLIEVYFFLRLIQHLLMDLWLSKMTGEKWPLIRVKVCSQRTVILLTLLLEVITSLKIFGILDILILVLLAVPVFVFIIFFIK